MISDKPTGSAYLKKHNLEVKNIVQKTKENLENASTTVFGKKEKQEIDYSLKNEKEYNKTIEYMFEDEQNRLLAIKRETNIIEEKLYNVGKYQKIITDNLKKNSKK